MSFLISYNIVLNCPRKLDGARAAEIEEMTHCNTFPQKFIFSWSSQKKLLNVPSQSKVEITIVHSVRTDIFYSMLYFFLCLLYAVLHIIYLLCWKNICNNIHNFIYHFLSFQAEKEKYPKMKIIILL